MFQSLFKRAEVAIEQTIGQLFVRLLAAVPFAIAACFGIAAVWLRLSREFTPETANLMMAGGFLAIGAVTTIILVLRAPADPALHNSTEHSKRPAADSQDPHETVAASDVDRELLMAAMTSAAPIALPIVARMVLRNLPLIAALGATIFVLSRPTPQPSETSPAE